MDVEWEGLITREENEVGITALQDQAQHLDIAVAMLKASETGELRPHIRFRGISNTTYRLPSRFKYVDEAFPLPDKFRGKKVRLMVEAVNTIMHSQRVLEGAMPPR